MKINKRTFLIKLHYFLFFGGMAPILPFGLVISLQLGSSVSLMGTVGALVLMLTMVVKPFISTFADAFPRTRGPLFVGTVLLFGLSLSIMAFVPQFTDAPYYSDAWIVSRDMFNSHSFSSEIDKKETEQSPGSSYQELKIFSIDLFPNSTVNESLSNHECGENRFTENLSSSKQTSFSWPDLFIVLPNNGSCELEAGRDCQFTWTSALLQLTLVNSSSNFSTYAVAAPGDASVQCVPSGYAGSLTCVGGQWATTECGGNPIHRGTFWSFVLLMILSDISYSTANSFTDAITMDTLGEDGDYGSQRLWGVLGWGLLGPLSSFLVDWHSGEAQTKDYTPAFILAAIFLGFDVIAASRLRVPVQEAEDTVFRAVKPLLKKVHFLVYLLSSLVSGVLNAVPLIYLFVLQEEVAAGTPAMQTVKLLQGLTVLVRCAAELPCMHFADVLVKKFGSERIESLVFVLHVLRLGIISVTSKWAPLWTTIPVEVLSGPVYGFGYTLVVINAKRHSPVGLSTTVQSLGNLCFDTLGYALASAISGVMIDAYGNISTFVGWAVVGAVAWLLHLVYTCMAPPPAIK
ncbi:uncharacterized protein LOC108670429, partial [Hyalella azteca]|uniref:Uncharacterized protein LOC108670429 n=1 Tax=Hyalella azteca TaxID=294128 RepID=A0A8B7NIC4_HYAAZ